jgi:hypothetical protein
VDEAFDCKSMDNPPKENPPIDMALEFRCPIRRLIEFPEISEFLVDKPPSDKIDLQYVLPSSSSSASIMAFQLSPSRILLMLKDRCKDESPFNPPPPRNELKALNPLKPIDESPLTTLFRFAILVLRNPWRVLNRKLLLTRPDDFRDMFINALGRSSPPDMLLDKFSDNPEIVLMV